MTTIANYLLKNTAKEQQHPFHLLSSSKLPIFMATFVGGLAFSIIVKLQSTSKLVTLIELGQLKAFLYGDYSLFLVFSTIVLLIALFGAAIMTQSNK